jgi:hypothetical protein
MKVDRKKRQLIILGGLFIILLFSLYRVIFQSGETSGKIPPSQAVKSPSVLDLKDIYLKRNPKKSGGRKETSFQDIDPAIHLERLENFDPGSPLNARNMFSQESAPPDQMASRGNPRNKKAVGSAVPEGPDVPGTGNPVPGFGRAAGVPAVVINLKFFGTVFDPLRKRRQGFFSEGDTVFFASEGDLLASRYRIIKIGDTTAEIEDVASKSHRQINLSTQ